MTGFVRVTIGLILLAVSGCAQLRPATEEAVIMEPVVHEAIIVEAAAPKRASGHNPCVRSGIDGDGSDDGIGGTGCSAD